jgi:hypothetical protein
MKKDRLLTGSVGHGGENKPEDVFLLRQLMPVAGGKEIEATNNDLAEGGLADSDFVEEIGGFQEDNGLTVDGVVKPGGETEQNIIAQITGEGADKVSAEKVVLKGDVGEGAKNEPEDVANVRRLLAAANKLPLNIAEPPPRFIDTKAVELLRSIQRDHGVFDTGRVSQGDETFQILQQKAGDASKDKRPNGEIQVAALPLLIPILLHAARTAAPHIIRSLPKLGAAIRAQQVLEETLPKKSERREVPDPLPAAHPGGPIEPPNPDDNREEFPEDPSKPQKEFFPALDPVGPWVEIFPDQSGEIFQTIIVKRHEREHVVVQNSDIMEMISAISKQVVRAFEHKGGARINDQKIKEYYLRNKLTGGNKGSSFLDVSFQDPVTKRFLHINTVDTKARGTQPSLREEKAAKRIIQNMDTERGDILVLIPKLEENETLDKEKFEEFITSSIKEVGTPYEKGRGIPVDRPRRMSPLGKPLSK